jgi:serine/threonine protein kinase
VTGPVVGDYELQRALGQGGMGRVWRATHVPTQRRVAVKFLSTDHQNDTRYHAAFEAEVRALAALHHPGIVPVLDHGVATTTVDSLGIEEGTPYLVMEYLSNGDLGSAGFLDWHGLRRIVESLLGALAHAHAHGIIHRDVKPGNILLDYDEAGPYAKLADFGIVWDSTQGRSALSLAAGSATYMAPEQAMARVGDFGPWTDLYALGCVVWRMVCGRPPFEGTPEVMLRKKLENRLPPFEPTVSVPRHLDRWLSILLHADTRNRFPHARDAAYGLSLLADSQPLMPARAQVRGEAPSPSGVVTRELTTTRSAPLTALAPREEERVQRPVAPAPGDWRLPSDGAPRSHRLGASLLHLQSAHFVGRDAERDRLWGLLTEATTSRLFHAARIVAPQGRGGSALVRWLGYRAEELGVARFIHVRHSAHDAPIEAWRDAVGRMLGAPESDLTSRLLRAADRYEWSHEVVRGLGRLLRREFQDHGEVYEAVLRWLVDHSRQRPTLVVIEDAQWAAAELSFVGHALRRGRALDLPAFIVESWSVQPEQNPPRVSEVPELALGPLTPREAQAFLQALVPLESAQLVDLIERSQGEPARIVRGVRRWARSGALGWKAGGFGLLPTATESDLLSDEDVWLQEHIRSLPDHAAAAADVAVALGEMLSIDDWLFVLNDDRRGLDDALRFFLDAELATFEPAYNRLSFEPADLPKIWAKHLRDSSRWQTAHTRCAERLVDLPDVAPERIARHWLQAGSAARAMELLSSHIDSLNGRFHVLRAAPVVTTWEQAADALGWPEDDARRLPVWELRANLAFYVNPGTLGQRANLEYWGARMRTVADAAGLKAWGCVARLLLAWHERLGTRRKEAIALAEQALIMGGSDVVLQCRARWERAINLTALDPRAALEDCAWILENAPRTSYLLPGTYFLMATAAHAVGDLDAAATAAQNALHHAHLGPARNRPNAWTELAKVELERGHLQAAREGFAAATAERERQGLSGGYAECYLASTLVLLDEFREALPILDRLIDAESPGNAAELRVWRALARWGSQDPAGAQRDLDRSLAWYEANPVRPDTALDAAQRLIARHGVTPEVKKLGQRLLNLGAGAR